LFPKGIPSGYRPQAISFAAKTIFVRVSFVKQVEKVPKRTKAFFTEYVFWNIN
jgi:hypothetical protein